MQDLKPTYCQSWQSKLRYWSIWTLLGVYLSIARTTEQSHSALPWWVTWYTEMTAAYLAGFVFPLATRFYDMAYFRNWSTAGHWLRHLLISPLVTIVISMLMDLVRYPFYTQLPPRYGLADYPWITQHFSDRFLIEWPRISVVYFSMVIAIFYKKMELRRQLEKQQAMQVQNELSTLQLLQLKSQLQPHFLFNTLNMISDKIATDPHQAEALLQQLSDLLRYYLVQSETHWVSLSQELEMLHAYLEILRNRFPTQIRYEEKVEPHLLEQKVPAMLLQPIIENAVMHTIHRYRGNVDIKLQIVSNRPYFQISVSNSLPNSGASTSQMGIGLKNIQKQLELLYSGDASLQLDITQHSAQLTIELPLEMKEKSV